MTFHCNVLRHAIIKCRFKLWIMLLFGVLGCSRVSGHLAGGVSGFLAGSALFFGCFCCCCSSLIQTKLFLIMHRYVSLVSLAKRASLQLENRVQFFTSHLTDDGLTEPDYIDQLACKQKKKKRAQKRGKKNTIGTTP